MMRTQQRGDAGGFTLLEVLVALAIVAIAATGFLAMGNNLFRLMGDSRDMDSVALLAREIEYKHGMNMSHPVRREGACDPPYEDCRWTIYSESTGEPRIALVRISVDCGRRGRITIERPLLVGGGR